MAETSYEHTAIAITLVLLCTWGILRMFQRESIIHYLPLPPGAHLVWGHEQAVFMNEPGRAFRKWLKEHGLTFRIKAAFGAKDILVLSDPVGISYILQKRIYDYHHSGIVRPRVGRLLGKGLAWIEGEAEHKRMRHLFNPSLSAENVKLMAGDVRLAATEVIDDFINDIQLRNPKEPVNILDLTARATLNVVGRVAFLHDFEKGRSPDAIQIIAGRRRGVSSSAQYAGFVALMLLRRFPILNKLPIQVIQSQALAKMAIQSGVAHELYRRNKDIVKDNHSQSPRDLLSRLLLAHADGEITKEEVYDQISTFIISGHETTTQMLAFTIFELARHPDIQNKLRDEISAFGREPTYDDFQTKLPYLDAVAKETLRLYPVLPYMERVATKSDSIPLGETVTTGSGQVLTSLPVTAGQVVLIPIIAIHRLDAIWHDGDVFCPERWFQDLPPSDKLCRGWAQSLAFSDGPRNCIGTRLALFQYKVILSSVLSKVSFGDTGAQVSLKVSTSLQGWVEGRPELGPCLPVTAELLR